MRVWPREPRGDHYWTSVRNLGLVFMVSYAAFIHYNWML
jgi:hypothetical protein